MKKVWKNRKTAYLSLMVMTSRTNKIFIVRRTETKENVFIQPTQTKETEMDSHIRPSLRQPHEHANFQGEQ